MKRIKFNIIVTSVIIGFALVGISCGSNKDYRPDSIEVAENYRFSDSLVPVDTMASDTIPTLGQVPWREFFGDSILISLIDKAVKNNLDMREAITNIEIANQMHKSAKVGNLPDVDLNVGEYVRELHSENYYSNPSGNYYGDRTPPDKLYTNKVRHSTSLHVSWEADIWGKFKNKKEAELASYLETQENKKTVQTQLDTEIDKEYN